jgi:hypothetical protein
MTQAPKQRWRNCFFNSEVKVFKILLIKLNFFRAESFFPTNNFLQLFKRKK